MGVLKEHKNREAELEQELLKKQAEIEEKNSEIQKLRDHLLYLVRQKFGTKSERHVGTEQLSLLKVQELLLEETTSKESTKQVETQTKKKRIPKRTTVPAEFPRRTEIIEPKDLPEGAIKIGEEVTEKLEFTPGEYWVRRIVRNKYSIPSTGTIAIGELPRFAIDKGIAGSSLLAHLIVGKYCDHIPFYRMAGILKRS